MHIRIEIITFKLNLFIITKIIIKGLDPFSFAIFKQLILFFTFLTNNIHITMVTYVNIVLYKILNFNFLLFSYLYNNF